MIIVVGASGYVGQQFVKELRNKNVGLFPLSRSDYDYYDIDILTDLIKEIKPEFLINCAGYSGKPNVDACEANKEETLRANAELPRTIGEACKRTGVPWGHVSSGCIYSVQFDEENPERGFTEEDPPNFSFEAGGICSYYSGTKALGELQVQEAGGDYYIWRLRIPFDEFNSPRNYISKLLTYDILLNMRNSVSHKGDFVRYCLETWEKKCDYGIYNIVNTGAVTASTVINKMKETFIPKGFADPYLTGTEWKKWEYYNTFEEFATHVDVKALRSNCILSNDKLVKAGVNVRSAEDALHDALNSWQP